MNERGKDEKENAKKTISTKGLAFVHQWVQKHSCTCDENQEFRTYFRRRCHNLGIMEF